MELRDYLQMLRRRWPAVVLITVLFTGCAALYLVVAPKRYESTTTLLVSATGLRNVGDLQVSAEFSAKAATTYAVIIDSATVLGPAAGDLRPQRDVDDLVASVTATVPTDTSLIVVTAADDRPDLAANVANAVATSAARVLPTLASASDGSPLIKLQQTRPAAEPTAAVSPNAKRVLVLGLVVGLCIGIATVIVAHTLDTRIRRVEDLRPVTTLPVLAVIPPTKRQRRAVSGGPDELAGVVGEAFRTLRTNLRFLEATGQRSVVVTAVADHGDGARVAIYLARSMTQAGRRVLLIDLDLRESPVAKMLGVDDGAGLADVLTDQADLARAIRATQYPGLRVLVSGTPHVGPSDLLSAPTLNRVLRWAEQEHDYVILHAPPLLQSADAAVVSGATGGTLVTVAAGHTRAHELKTALSDLANAQVKPLGVVLSGARSGGAAANPDSGHPTPPPTVHPILRNHPMQQGRPVQPMPPGQPRPRHGSPDVSGPPGGGYPPGTGVSPNVTARIGTNGTNGANGTNGTNGTADGSTLRPTFIEGLN